MKTLVFDLDGTLTESKQSIDPEMAALIGKLLETHNIAIISGASWKQLETQVLNKITKDPQFLTNLYIMPTSGAGMYQLWGKYGWVAVYQLKLNRSSVHEITKAIEKSLVETSWVQPDKLWGKQIENRESQITFSALGQKAPIEKKDGFDSDLKKRTVLLEYLQQKIPNYDIRIGGSTSIDVSLRGINKKYGIEELIKRLHISKDDIVYIGDAIFKGGNDYVAIELGLDFVKVQDPEDTKKWIRSVLDGEDKLEKSHKGKRNGTY